MKNNHQRQQAICRRCTEWRSTTRMRHGICWNCQKKTKKETKTK